MSFFKAVFFKPQFITHRKITLVGHGHKWLKKKIDMKSKEKKEVNEQSGKTQR